MTAAGFKNLWPCTGQQQLHTYVVPQSEYLAKNSDRGGREVSKTQITNIKMVQCSTNARKMSHPLLQQVAHRDAGKCTCVQACCSTHADKHCKQAGVRTFPEDLCYCQFLMYDTLGSCVLAIHRFFLKEGLQGLHYRYICAHT